MRILTDKGEIAVEELIKGDLVKTTDLSYRPITKILKSTIYNPPIDLTKRQSNRLYVYSKHSFGNNVPNMDLIITGCHSVLVPTLTDDEREKIENDYGEVYLTDKQYRLPAYIDKRTTEWLNEGYYDIYHFALENNWEHGNYGVFANGVLVESASEYDLCNYNKM